MEPFNGLGMGLHNISRLSKAKTRSISAENFTGEKGKAGMATEGTGANAARDLGLGWKVSPSISIEPRQIVTLAEIEGPGAIQHIWNTVHPTWWRRLVIRFYWDGEETPSVEVPIGDLFCNGWCERCNIASLPVAVNPAGGVQLLLGDALPEVGEDHAGEPDRREVQRLLLPGHVCTHGCPGGCRPTSTRSSAGPIRCRMRRCIRCSTACRDRGITLAPIWRGR